MTDTPIPAQPSEIPAGYEQWQDLQHAHEEISRLRALLDSERTRLVRALAVVIRGQDALESNTEHEARREAFEMGQVLFDDDALSALHAEAEALVPTIQAEVRAYNAGIDVDEPTVPMRRHSCCEAANLLAEHRHEERDRIAGRAKALERALEFLISHCINLGWPDDEQGIAIARGMVAEPAPAAPAEYDHSVPPVWETVAALGAMVPLGEWERARQAQWQPIETAPQDGREVLLLNFPRTLVGHWMPGGHCIEDHPPIDAGWYFWGGSQFERVAGPSHWMSLPLTPEALKASLAAKEPRE